jgi:F-type H+-transporting ATPase subunit gamma
MKAMNLVAASKVQRNRARLEAVRPLFKEARLFLEQGVVQDEAAENIYCVEREVNASAYVVVTGERGLCGSYNANVLKMAYEHMEDKNMKIISVGARCKEYFVRRRKPIFEENPGVLENVSFRTAEKIAATLNNMFISDNKDEAVEEVWLAYTRFETLLSHEPCMVRLLPFGSVGVPMEGYGKYKIYEPNVNLFLKKSVPAYLAMFLYGAMIESALCEQASRMTSMDAATRNAGEIIDDLTLQFNRQRQGAITQEISEIVGGANAI